jgi:hypothetical protein
VARNLWKGTRLGDEAHQTPVSTEPREPIAPLGPSGSDGKATA